MNVKNNEAALPSLAIGGFIGFPKKKQALAFARDKAEKWFEGQEYCWIAVHRHEYDRDGGVQVGWLWEAHQGGDGLSFMPSAVAALEAGEDSAVIPTLTRDLVVEPRSGGAVECLILPEEPSRRPPTEGVGFIGPKCRPLRQSGIHYLFVGLLALVLGASALGYGVTERVSRVAATSVKPLTSQQMSNLPSSRVSALKNVPDDKRLVLLKLTGGLGAGGRWTQDFEDRPVIEGGSEDVLPPPPAEEGAE